jgi:hypothetical protein
VAPFRDSTSATWRSTSALDHLDARSLWHTLEANFPVEMNWVAPEDELAARRRQSQPGGASV